MTAGVSPAFAQWVHRARQAAQQAPDTPRQALMVAGHVVGSVAPGFLGEKRPHRWLDIPFSLSFEEHSGGADACWHLDVPAQHATAALNALALVLRQHGRCGPWRDEQLAVHIPRGERIATVERGAVRVLGIATRAVHLVGLAPDGRMWVQQRSLTKPNHPGLWDTLMGGMVAADDTLEQALARETWEEAGLRIAALGPVAHGGHVDFSRPSDEGGGWGYMVERIDWFQAQVPIGVEPLNQDGEVERFDLVPVDAVCAQVAQGQFTPEAGLVIAGLLGQ